MYLYIYCTQIFGRLIFVVSLPHKNIFTTKISQITVYPLVQVFHNLDLRGPTLPSVFTHWWNQLGWLAYLRWLWTVHVRRHSRPGFSSVHHVRDQVWIYRTTSTGSIDSSNTRGHCVVLPTWKLQLLHKPFRYERTGGSWIEENPCLGIIAVWTKDLNAASHK